MLCKKYDTNIVTGADILGYQITFLKKKQENVYVYPENADLGDIAYNDIISHMNVPNIGRRGEFT